MQHIDIRFKDNDPKETVKQIQDILQSIGVEVTETWYDSGVEGCYSLSVYANGGVPSANGKGVTKELARASAYGEFIERLQGGLFTYKYQSIHRIPAINLHAYAPDKKYMTTEELIACGEWMDSIIWTYGQGQLTRNDIAEQCLAYACSDDDRILTVPFYSLFENKYVYLPIAFVDQIYATNGCCVGNTKEEAWVHALSEMMERHASLKMLTSGKSAPKIPDETLRKYPTVSKILDQIRSNKDFEVDIFDYSIGNGFPVVSTRIISKKDHSYRVNVAADPVFEIAVKRTLTELFQGKNLDNITKRHNGTILKNVSDFSAVDNVINQLETSSGFFTADFFADELTCETQAAEFQDNSAKTNAELLEYMLSLYREMGKPVYVRNFSFLGFPCYRFVVPGFSEALSVRLTEPFSQYAFADEAAKTLRDAASATNDDLVWMMMHSDSIRGIIGRYNQFGRISGIPLANGSVGYPLTGITRAYASYRLGRLSDAISYLNTCIDSSLIEESDKVYFQCINRYLQLVTAGIAQDKIRSIMGKFFTRDVVERMYEKLDNNMTPYDDYLICCHYTDCENCRYRSNCAFLDLKEMYKKAGTIYSKFIDGQKKEAF